MNAARLMQTYYLQRFCWPRLRRVCIAAMVWDPSRPDDVSSWDFARFKEGTVDHVKGYDIPAMLVEYDVLILQHWPTSEIIERIRERCPKLKILLWAAIEAIHAENRWSPANPLQEELRQECALSWERGTDGGFINIYEGQSKPEAYAVSVFDLDLDAVTGILHEAIWSSGADGAFTDTMTSYSYYGSAKNAIPRYERDQFWIDYSAVLRDIDLGLLLWGNTVGPSPLNRYGLDVCFAEQYFYQRESIEIAARDLHDGLCLNTQRSSWAQYPGAFRFLAHEMALRGLYDVYVCTARTGEQYLPGVQWHW